MSDDLYTQIQDLKKAQTDVIEQAKALQAKKEKLIAQMQTKQAELDEALVAKLHAAHIDSLTQLQTVIDHQDEQADVSQYQTEIEALKAKQVTRKQASLLDWLTEHHLDSLDALEQQEAKSDVSVLTKDEQAMLGLLKENDYHFDDLKVFCQIKQICQEHGIDLDVAQQFLQLYPTPKQVQAGVSGLLQEHRLILDCDVAQWEPQLQNCAYRVYATLDHVLLCYPVESDGQQTVKQEVLDVYQQNQTKMIEHASKDATTQEQGQATIDTEDTVKQVPSSEATTTETQMGRHMANQEETSHSHVDRETLKQELNDHY